jgi:dihydrofolate reductase
MRKVIVSSYATLDGRVDDIGKWASPWNGDEVAAYHSSLLADSDGLLLGRNSYQAFAMIWPPRVGQAEYADKINKMAKYVASTTLTDADLAWENSHLIEGEVADGVAKLKEQPGGDLVVYGGPSLISTLQENDLVDEYRVMVHPVLLGTGRGLIKAEGARVDLELVGTEVIAPGVVILTYRPKR